MVRGIDPSSKWWLFERSAHLPHLEETEARSDDNDGSSERPFAGWRVADEALAKYLRVSRTGGYLSAERAEPTLAGNSLHNLFCPLADAGQEGRVMAPTQNRSRSLPEKPSEEHLRKQAKDLARGEAIQLAAAQRRLAREYGYRNWSELIRHVKSLSAAHKATREADEATGPTPLEAGPALKSLWKRVADLPRSLNLLDKQLLADLDPFPEGPDPLVQLRRSVLDQVRDLPELLELYEKLRFRSTALELEKDLPFLPLRDLIAFPHMVYPVFVGRSKSIKAIRSAMNRQLPIVMAAQKDPALESPNDADIYRIGVVGSLIK